MNYSQEEIEKGTFRVGDYLISKSCLSMFPCVHSIKKIDEPLFYNEKGDTIYKWLHEKGLSHPHFDFYKEYIRRIEHPTPKEIEEDRLAKIKSEENIARSEKYFKEQEKNQGINRASYHLDRLKSKNNIK